LGTRHFQAVARLRADDLEVAIEARREVTGPLANQLRELPAKISKRVGGLFGGGVHE
jgi:hypothetical protein